MSNASPARITARIDLDAQRMLSQAAAIIGVSSLNSFILNAAIEKSKKIIERENTLKLSERAAVALVEALDSESKPNPRLRRAAKRYYGETR